VKIYDETNVQDKIKWLRAIRVNTGKELTTKHLIKSAIISKPCLRRKRFFICLNRASENMLAKQRKFYVLNIECGV